MTATVIKRDADGNIEFKYEFATVASSFWGSLNAGDNAILFIKLDLDSRAYCSRYYKATDGAWPEVCVSDMPDASKRIEALCKAMKGFEEYGCEVTIDGYTPQINPLNKFFDL